VHVSAGGRTSEECLQNDASVDKALKGFCLGVIQDGSRDETFPRQRLQNIAYGVGVDKASRRLCGIAQQLDNEVLLQQVTQQVSHGVRSPRVDTFKRGLLHLDARSAVGS
jgi:hypothetical protein